MRNVTKRHRSSVRRRCRALFIAAALAAVSTLPVRAADMEVNIDNFAFTPKELTVKAGTTIVFRNRDDIPHSVVGSEGDSIPRRSIRTIVFHSPSPKPGPTPILVACIRECRAGSWSR